MPPVSLRARLGYQFDTRLSRGPAVVISWLGIVTVMIVLIAALVLTAFRVAGVAGHSNLDLPQAFWESMIRVLDTAALASDSSWPARFVGLVVTLSGIFIAGSLIGLIANAVDQRIEQLHKGRSRVLESDHTLVLGWSARVPAIVKELVVANESRRHAAIVVLADKDKGEMEQMLREYVGDSKTTRIVCRSGAPWLPQNLALANVERARSIIVISDGRDANTTMCLLAAQETIAASSGELCVVAEVNEEHTHRSLSTLLGESVALVSSANVVAEMTAQACRQRGLSTVFRGLLEFDGDEIYFARFAELAGRTYVECQLAFDKCSPIGILDENDVVHLNPPASTTFGAHHKLIGIAEDDSTFLPSRASAEGHQLAVEDVAGAPRARRIVITGWSDLGPRVIAALDEFFDKDTTLHVIVDPRHVDASRLRTATSAERVSLEIDEFAGGPELVAEFATQAAPFDELIVLGYRDSLDLQEADARTLLTLLAFRRRLGDQADSVRMVAELLDQRNVPLAQATGAHDFIVSDEMTSLMLAQLSERTELQQVFNLLFHPSGCSIEFRPGLRYGATQASTFADIVVTASARGDTAIGYRRARTGEVVVNPSKAEPMSLQDGDDVLVIAPPTGTAPEQAVAAASQLSPA